MDRHDRFAFLSAEARGDKEHGLPGRAQLGAGPVGIRTLRMPGGGVTKLMRVMQTNACSLSCGYCPTFCGGKVKRVDVSLDGGRNWRTARIDGPVLDKACVRFYYEFDWKGEEALLQSRVMDETGYVQPSKDALRKIRGVNSIYHNNGIQTWALRANGEVENVEIG